MSGVWEPASAVHDCDPPRDPSLPSSSYIVCSTPRSGSGLLVRGLASAGGLGVPVEYFNPRQRQPLTERWGCGTDPVAYVAAIRRFRSSPAGLLGTKLHWDQLARLTVELEHRLTFETLPYDLPSGALDELFPGARYVHITRSDVDRQAVSLWTAMHRDVWDARVGGPSATAHAQVPYSDVGLERCRRYLLESEARWRRFFDANGIVPVLVVYERLVDDFEATVRRVRVAIGGAGMATAPVDTPDSVVLRDAASDALLQRFRRARAGRDLAPPPTYVGVRSGLQPGERLEDDEALVTGDGRTTLAVSAEGTAEVRQDGLVRWASPTAGSGASVIVMQPDGNLVLVAQDGRPAWSAATHGHPGARARLRADGRLEVSGPSGDVLWLSGP